MSIPGSTQGNRSIIILAMVMVGSLILFGMLLSFFVITRETFVIGKPHETTVRETFVREGREFPTTPRPNPPSTGAP